MYYRRFVLLIVLLLASCATRTELEKHQFYTRNYGGFVVPNDEDSIPADDFQVNTEAQDATEGEAQRRVGRIQVQRTELPPEPAEELGEEKEAEPTGTVAQHTRKYQVLSDDPLIERAFTQCEAYYEIRDYPAFEDACNFFLDSFPQSAYTPRIQEMFASFYTSDGLEANYLNNGLVEIEFPLFLDRTEMDTYFARLRKIGVKEVAWAPFQQGGEKKILFAHSGAQSGAYFRSQTLPTVDDVLGDVLQSAHSHGLKVLIIFPLRNYPWLKYYDSDLMGQYRTQVRNREEFHAKLNLLHIVAPDYLRKILSEIMRYDIDGVLFDDDYVYRLGEGYSSFNQIRYEDDKGKVFNARLSLPESWLFLRKENYQVMFEKRYKRYKEFAEWRVQQVHALLAKLIGFVQQSNRTLKTGIKTFPEVVNNARLGLFWYTMQHSYISGLPVNFFLLNWKQGQELQHASQQEYVKAARYLTQSKREEQELYLSVPLENKSHMGMLPFRERVRELNDLLFELGHSKLAVSAVNRLEDKEIPLP